jgi:uncharacterized protein (TIGR01777 family)
MELALALLTLQGLLGAADNLWNHELKVALPARPGARRELALHALRAALYVPLFLTFAWLEPHGWLTLALAACMLIEIVVTLLDFVEEDRTRVLPTNERVLHTLLAVNFGAFLASAAPILLQWARSPAAAVAVDHGVWSWLMTVCGLGALAWAVRDALAAYRLGRPALATWQRKGLRVVRQGQSRCVLVTGATGFVGRHLCWRLVERGDHVVALVRDKGKAADLFGPHVETIASVDHIHRTRRIDAVVNLAGAPIAGWPWTPRRRAELVESRIGTTRMLLEWMARQSRRPAVLINASAIGWYGARGDEVLAETSAGGTDFPAALCRAWEREALSAQSPDVRVVVLRLGLVLGDGGLLRQLRPVFRLGLGAVFGSGRQWTVWLHIYDAVGLIAWSIATADVRGIVNAVSPQPVRNRDFAAALACVLRRPLLLRVPAWCLRLILGEQSTLLIDGQRVVPEKLRLAGYRFRFTTLTAALADLAETRRTAARGSCGLHHALR